MKQLKVSTFIDATGYMNITWFNAILLTQWQWCNNKRTQLLHIHLCRGMAKSQ